MGACLTRELASPEVFGAGDGDVRLDLPPGFELVALREGFDAFAHAQTIAAQRGAGTLVWTRRFDLVEFAVVLEPEEPLLTARRAFYACMNAMADSLAVHCPPEKPVNFAWPGTLLFDGGIIGGGQLAWPTDTLDEQPPEWLVFGGIMRSAVMRGRMSPVSLEPGTWASGTALEVEGFDELDIGALIESFTRHLMTHMYAWGERGFKSIGRDYLARLEPDKALRRGIDGNGDLLTHVVGNGKNDSPAERTAFFPALAAAAWLDHDTREPVL
jgi:Biotin/lipoate A/B protein ligase family